MPGHLELKKDAANGETRRGAVRTQRSGDIRMGEPGKSNVLSSMYEHIVHERGTWGSETSKYPEEKKTKVIPKVAASERGGAQTTQVGLRTTTCEQEPRRNQMELITKRVPFP